MKRILSVVLALAVVLTSFVAFNTTSQAATTPSTVTVAQAQARLNTLVSKFNGKYFTVNQKPCGYDLEAHPPTTCSNCQASKVVAQSWCKNLVGMGSISASNFPNMYYTSSIKSDYPDGYSCFGFANFAHWYIFAQKNTDNLVSSFVASGSFGSSTLNNARPGDAIWIYNPSKPYWGHAAIYISHNSTGVTVLDCNWRSTAPSKANCYVQKEVLTYSKIGYSTVTITGVTNYNRNVTPTVKPSGAVLKASAKSYSVGDTGTFTMTANNATDYNLRIMCGDTTEYLVSNTSKTRTFKFTKEGLYTAWFSAVNSAGFVDSAKIYFTVGYNSPVDTINFGTSKYDLYLKNTTWKEAKAFCESKGGHLVTITSAEENDALAPLRQKTNALNTLSNSQETHLWIGATDEVTEGTWKWVTGEPFSYANWETGEPNNGSGGEDYAETFIKGTWNDNSGDVVTRIMGFIMETEYTDSDIVGISVKTLPTKTSFNQYEPINTDGLTVEVTYPSGTKKTVTSGFTVSDVDTSTLGTKTVTVNYGGYTATFTVEVTDPSDWSGWIPTSSLADQVKNAPAGTYEFEYKDGYETRTKQTTVSGKSALDGWTLYDKKSSSSTSSGYDTAKPSTSPTVSGNSEITKSYQTYYYYYLWGYEMNSDPTYMAEDTKASLISAHGLSSYDKSKLRYIYVYSTQNHGSKWPQYSGSTYYTDDNGKSGTINVKNGNVAFYYGGERYKVTTTTTRYYYYKWSDWGNLSMTSPSATDTTEVRIATNGYVRYKLAEKAIEYTYDPVAAVNYAEKYAHNRNTAYADHTTNDCANFVSQCLAAGGIPTNDTWKPESSAWIGCGDFYRFLTNGGYGTSSAELCTTKAAKVGDVIVKYKDSWYLHAMLVVGKDAAGNPLIADHTEDENGKAIGRFGTPLNTLTSGYTYYVISMKGKVLPTYTVTYKQNGGSGSDFTQAKTFGEAISVSPVIPAREGYKFLGWSKNSGATAADYKSGQSFSENADTVLYAVWEKEVVEPPVTDGLKIKVESKSVSAGKQFTVTVDIEENPGFSYLELTPVYSDVFTLVSVENGQLLTDFTKGIQYIWTADNDVKTDGRLATFTFTAAESAEAGKYSIGFTVRSCVNYDEQNVDAAVVGGKIEISDIMYGDANGDGIINGQDIVRLKKYLAGYDYEVGTSTISIEGGADANGDGQINGQDIVRLKKYLAGYNYETGTSTIALGPNA